MSWRRRWRAWLRAKLSELGKRAGAARAAWKDPQPVLRPYWPPRATSGVEWNYDLRFQSNESILGIFIPVRNELLCDPRGIAPAVVSNEARAMARFALQEEVDRLADR